MTPPSRPSIRLSPRSPDGPQVYPQDFLLDREKAMQAVLSSRYKRFAYNYGGYIPYDIEKRREEEAMNCGFDDYKEFLRVRRCDFVNELILGETVPEAIVIDPELLKKQEEEARILRQEEERKEQIRQEGTKFRRGTWNIKIMDYLEDISGQHPQHSKPSTKHQMKRTIEPSVEVGIDDEPAPLENIVDTEESHRAGTDESSDSQSDR